MKSITPFIYTFIFFIGCSQKNDQKGSLPQIGTEEKQSFNHDEWQKLTKEFGEDTSKYAELLMDYYPHWITDSAAKNGFRQLLSNEFLKKCNFEGIKWSKIESFFGKPNYEFKSDTSIIYRYKASDYRGNDSNTLFAQYVQFEIKDGIIIRFKVYNIDG